MVYTAAERRLNVAKQLRDRYGKWIFMGGSIKWFEGGKWNIGKVTGIFGDTVTVEGRKGSLHKSRIESMDSKARLPVDIDEDDFKPTPPEQVTKRREADPLDIDRIPAGGQVQVTISARVETWERLDQESWTRVDDEYPNSKDMSHTNMERYASFGDVKISKEDYDRIFGNPDEIEPEDDTDVEEAPVSKSRFRILEDTGVNGDGWHSSGPWGKFGASGVMFRVPGDDREDDRYMLIQRSESLDNPFLWQLPGGAMDSNEDAYQGAARETHEELGLTQEQLDQLVPAGEVIFDNGKGWAYTNIAADAPEAWDFEEVLKKHESWETRDAQWFTADEIRQMRDEKKLIPAFGANVESIFDKFYDKDSEVIHEPDISIPRQRQDFRQGIGRPGRAR